MSGVYRFLACVSATAWALALGGMVTLVLQWNAPPGASLNGVDALIGLASFTLALIPFLKALSIPIGAVRHRLRRGSQGSG